MEQPVLRLFVGGGSGGGASMLWPPDGNDQYEISYILSYIVSGGGGGTSVGLNYSVFILPPNRTAEEYYIQDGNQW